MTYHLYSQYTPKNPEAQRRHQIAQSTWAKQPWKELPVKDSDLPRLWTEDGGALPFIKDVFDFAVKGKDPADIIIYTNADIMARNDCAARVVAAMQNVTACYCYRRDFHHRIEKPIPDSDYAKGMLYAGSDLFAFRADWWTDFRDFMEDMIMGFEAYDPMLRQLADETNPQGGTRLEDLICHERHYSMWEDPKNRYTLKGQLKCLALAKKFFIEHGINPAMHHIR